MPGTVEDGSNSQHAEGIIPLPDAGLSTSSGTIDHIPQALFERHHDLPSMDGQSDDRTVISQQAVAAPEEFYRSMPLPELAAMLEGRQLDHFAVEQMIGGGGMGAVFRGRDLRLDRVVAIKVIPAAKRDPETLRRFRLEAQAAAKLDHPNIARVYYVGESQQWNYIVFEFIDGVNIRDLVDMEGPLSVDDAVYYTRQVAEALQHAFEREVVHRDIKPSNVLVTATGAAKVVDMGLARNTALDKSTTDETASGVTLGTFDYISPEQARNPRDADVRSDLYSLGCTLFYMLTGNPPFPEGTALQKLLNHGSQAPPDPRGWRDDLSDELYEITMKLMAKRPSDRYQTPTELISDLMMLAEAEDLPRSQSTGTLLVTTNIAQHSLLESNLPWLVALSFLLGSTLWLASFERLADDFEIGELDYQSPPTEPLSAPPQPNPAQKPEANQGEQTNGPTGIASPVFGPTNDPRTSGANTPSNVVSSSAAEQSSNGASYGLGNAKPSDVASAELPAMPPTALPSTEINPAFRPAGNSTTTTPPRGLVVSAELPLDIDPQQWESSLASAVHRLDYDVASDPDGSQEIEIRGRIVLRRALEISGQNLRIVSGPGSSAVIEVAEDLIVASNESSGAINLQASKLKLRGIAFEATVPDDVPVRRQGLFALRGSSQLDMESCTVTIRDYSSSESLHIVSYNDSATSTNLSRPARAAGAASANGVTPASGESIAFRSAMCVFRGDTNLVRLNITDANLDSQVDLSLTDTLVAVGGSVLEMHAPTGEAQPQRFVRMLCDKSTLVSEQSFAKLAYTGEQTPLVGLLRTSQSCIYWTGPQAPHVMITGAPRQSLLGNFNLLLLQGMNNFYDSKIEVLCQSYLGSTPIAAFGFVEASTSGWLAERANESRVRWQVENFPPYPLRDASPRDFAVADLLFVPGITTKKLPIPEVN
jgi:serine/threonine protein kinase